jgi:hypothetical protein
VEVVVLVGGRSYAVPDSAERLVAAIREFAHKHDRAQLPR